MPQPPTEDADYIIIGAGSAGCVLADRLSESGRHSVCLLEAGGKDWHPYIHIPIGYGRTFTDRRFNWMYETEPDPGINGRRSYWPRGKVLGGSSSINAMVYVRGHPRDFEDWQAAGNPGWGWPEVLPWFRHSEDNEREPDPWHQRGGRLGVSSTDDQVHPLCHNFLAAATEAGFAITEDFNGEHMEGVGLYQITTQNGRRSSTARAFLSPARRRSNLRIETHAMVSKIGFESGRASTVSYTQRGQPRTLRANREIIVSAGAINSPQLLELSGIGNPEHLRARGLEVQVANNNVGEHLQDHIGINYYYRSRVPTLNDSLHPWHGKLREGIKYLLTRRGHLSLSVNQAGGFIRTSPGLAAPNMQLYFTPISYTRAKPGQRLLMNPDPFSAYLMGFQACRPTSRGSVHIHDSNPDTAPTIKPGYLDTEEDREEVIAACHLMRRLAAAPSLSSITENEYEPGIELTDDDELLEDFRDRADTVFHPIGTCRMSDDASQSVVSASLQVHGVTGLRVVDASVFPNLTSGNTNAPTIMVAERASQLILEDANSV